jgi:hypothetical protein
LGSGFEARESAGEPELGSAKETTPLNAQHEAAFEDCFRRYRDPERGGILAELLESNQITELTPMVIQEGFLKWLASTGWKAQDRRNQTANRPKARIPIPRAARKKQLRAKTQRLFEENPGDCIKKILEDRLEEPEGGPPESELHAFWENLFSQPSKPDSRTLPQVNSPNWNLAAPITAEEISIATKLMGNKAPGEDRITREKVRQL